MGAVDIVLRRPHNVKSITAGQQPDWSFDNLLLEFDSIEKKHNVHGITASKKNYHCTQGFVMRVKDDYFDIDNEEEADNLSITPGRRFACDELFMSAEALGNYLTALQRDHGHISLLEERKIRDDAASQEAKRKEKALQEEKLRLEKIKADDEEIRLKLT